MNEKYSKKRLTIQTILKNANQWTATAVLFLLFAPVPAFSWPSVFPTGTTLYLPGKAFNGYTLFALMDSSPHATKPYKYPGKALLIDMNGNIVHQWRLPFPPGLYARLLPNGNLLVQCKTTKEDPPDRPGVGKYPMSGYAGWLYELDWNGKILFQYQDPNSHHDFQKMPNGNYIYIGWEPVPKELQKKVRGGLIGTEHGDETMFTDYLREINPQGETVWEWHAHEAFAPDIDIIGPFYKRTEWFHGNSVDAMKDGNLLLSGRHTDTVMIIDKKTKKIIWRWGSVAYLDKDTGQLEFRLGSRTMGGQHSCSEIPEGYPGAGNILCYDNGIYMGQSRGVEIDPKTDAVVWQTSDHGVPRGEAVGRKHFSNFVGSAQRLPNGNTMICDGANGRFFEVTRDLEIVWEYVSPYITVKSYQAAVFRAHRHAPDYCPQFKGLPPPRGPAVTPPDHSQFEIGEVLFKKKERAWEKGKAGE